VVLPADLYVILTACTAMSIHMFYHIVFNGSKICYLFWPSPSMLRTVHCNKLSSYFNMKYHFYIHFETVIYCIVTANQLYCEGQSVTLWRPISYIVKANQLHCEGQQLHCEGQSVTLW